MSARINAEIDGSGPKTSEKEIAPASGRTDTSATFSEKWPTKRLRFATQRAQPDQHGALLSQAKVAFLPMEALGERDDIEASFEREVRPHVPDTWMDRSKDKIGYEINFNCHLYKYTPPRPLEVIDGELKEAEEEVLRLLREVTE